MKKLVAALMMALFASAAHAQFTHTLDTLEMRPNGSIYMRVTSPSLAVRANTTRLFMSLRRASVLNYAYDVPASAPAWAYWTGTDYDFATSMNAGTHTESARGRVAELTPHQFDADSVAWDIQCSSEWVPDQCEVQYWFRDINGNRSQKYYSTLDRMFATPRSETTTLTYIAVPSTRVFDDTECEVQFLVATDDTVAIALQIWDSVGTIWTPTQGPFGDAYSGWVPAATGWPMIVQVPSAITTDGQTRYYVRTLDLVVHGPYAGPTIVTSSCGDVTIE